MQLRIWQHLIRRTLCKRELLMLFHIISENLKVNNQVLNF